MLSCPVLLAGGPLGSGKQWMSWIHRDDLVELIIESLKNSSYQGIYNATAPKPVRMSELCSSMGGLGLLRWQRVHKGGGGHVLCSDVLRFMGFG